MRHLERWISHISKDGTSLVLRHRLARHRRSSLQVPLISCIFFPSGEDSQCALVLQLQPYLDILDEMDKAGEQSDI